MAKQIIIEELVDAVIKATERPIDEWAVAATLESMGLRDVDAVHDFGKRDIFDLASDIFQKCLAKLQYRSSLGEKDEALGARSQITSFFRFYSSGLMFAMPMAGQIAMLFILRYSLWAYFDFTEEQATIVALGTILGFIVTGGFIQVIARRGIFYREQKLYALVKGVCFHITKIATVAIFAIGIIVYLVNALFPFLSQQMIIVSLMYYVLTAHLWISMSLLYTLEKRLAILIATLFGVGVVYLVLTMTTWDIMPAQWCGLLAADIMMYAIGYIVLHRWKQKMEGNLRLAKLPRESVLVYAVRYYFIYGTLYFAYLFLDRIVGWSSSTGADVPYLFWFRTSYELGMDWALFSFIIAVGSLEYSIRRFSQIMIPKQKKFLGWDSSLHNRYFTRFYLRQCVLLVITTIISITLVYYGGICIRDHFPDVRLVQDFFANPLTFTVFWAGAAGYALTTIGLLNCSFFFTLSRPTLALRAIVPAFVVNLIVGFILSRAISYEYSVYGLVAGALVFAVISTINGWRLMRSLDYYYYSAY